MYRKAANVVKPNGTVSSSQALPRNLEVPPSPVRHPDTSSFGKSTSRMQRRLGEVAQQLVKQGHLPAGRHPGRVQHRRADVLADQGIRARLHRIVTPDEYAPVGPPTHLYRHYGLDAPGILARIRAVTADSGVERWLTPPVLREQPAVPGA